MSKSCQSCGMPMRRDPEGGGTAADGSRSAEFCSLCYRDGLFTQPEMEVRQMQAFCIDKLHEHHVPRPLGWLMTRNLPRLERWRPAA